MDLVFLIIVRVVAKALFQFPSQPPLRWRFVECRSVHFARGQDAAGNLAVHAVASPSVLVLNIHVEADHGFAVVIAEAVGRVVEIFF